MRNRLSFRGRIAAVCFAVICSMLAGVTISSQAMAATETVDVFIGDSTTSALGVSDAQRWSKLYADEDNAVEKNYAVSGAGWINYAAKNYQRQYGAMSNELAGQKDVVKRIFFVGGSNDLAHGKTVAQIEQVMTTVLSQACEDFPNAQVIYIPEILVPSPKNLAAASKYATQIRQIVAAAQSIEGVHVAANFADWLAGTTDTWQSDGSHPNAKGHRLAAEKILQYTASLDADSGTVTIRFDANGGQGSHDPVTVPRNSTYVIPPQSEFAGVTREGYTLVGCTTSKDGSGTVYRPGSKLQVADKDVTLYAKWEVSGSLPNTGSTPGQAAGIGGALAALGAWLSGLVSKWHASR